MQVIRSVLLPVVAVIVISVVVYLYWQPLPTTKNQYPRPNLYTEFGQQSAHGHSANQSSIIVSEAERTTLKAKIQNASLSSNTETVTMLMWSRFSYGPWPIGKTHTENCYGHRCLFTIDKSFFSDSDIIVIHGRAPGIKDSVNQALKLKRPPHQRWVMLNKESPANTPDLGFLNGHINWTVNFMADADIAARSFVVPGTFQGGFDPGKNYLEKKTGMAAILVSHCVPARMKWVTTMQQYIDVNVYGACGPLNCSRNNKEECFAELRKYKFYLSFENSFCKDYITEKFYKNALQNRIIPILISGVNTSDVTYVPPGSFINALDFPTVKDLTEHMKKVGSSPELYNEYFRWHSNYTLNTEEYSITVLLHKLCKKAHLDPFSEKSYSNIGWWYSFKKNCKTYPAPVPR